MVTPAPDTSPDDTAPAAPLTLPDILASGLDLVIVGINPSVYSAERGQYFARPSNRFWPLLCESGLLPERLGPADGPRLPEFGIGLTDLVQRATPSAADLTAADFVAGRLELAAKLERVRPRAVLFIGKIAWERFSGVRLSLFGRQPETVAGAAVFVSPSTSGRANRLHAERRQTLAEVRAYLGR